MDTSHFIKIAPIKERQNIKTSAVPYLYIAFSHCSHFKKSNPVMSFDIPISILDLTNIREGEDAAAAIRNSIKMAQDAESMGFNRFWLAEHHNMPSIASTSTALLINMVADKTEKIKVGSGGIMLPNHAPLSVAESFGTLATMYPDRIDLGLGRAPGTDGYTAAALRRNFAATPYDFKANIEELQSYFSTDNEGKRVRAFLAEGKQVPIWILGSSTDSAYLAAAMGLPYAFAAHFSPGHLMAASRIYKEHFQASEYLDKPYFMACVNVIAADSGLEAQELATSLQQMFVGIITNTRVKMPPPLPGYEMMMEQELHMALQQMLYYTFIGDKHLLQEKLQQFIAEAQVDELMVTNYIYDLNQRKHAMEILSEIFHKN